MGLIARDRELIRRCLHHEPGAWNDFVDRFLGLVYHVVQHTAALVSIGRLGEASEKSGPSAPNTPCTLLMSAVLLSGFDDADGAALDLVAETPGFCDNPHLDVASYERARTLARPLMVQAFISQETFLNGHLRTLCDALADAFFTQFGATSEADEEDEEEGPDKQAA